MENIFTAIIIIFVLLFGILTLSTAFLSAQEVLYDAWQAAYERNVDLEATAIRIASIQILNSGNQIAVTVHNEGQLKLADFDDWDVFVQYYDSSTSPVYVMDRLEYSNSSPSTNEWHEEQIYVSTDAVAVESFEVGLFNPGEALVLHLNVSPAVGVGQTAHVTVTTTNGVSASLGGMRNAPPTLAVNSGLKLASGSSAVITAGVLTAVDVDNAPDELTFTVVTPPEDGTLTPQATFTQAQIENGDVVYDHSGSDDDQFSFTITDGLELIGEYTFDITVNTAPALVNNVGLTLPVSGTATITSLLLSATDTDQEDVPGKLTYTIVQFPVNGTLNLGSTFTQADVDNNQLTYTHTAADADADMFRFVVSDGYDVIGSYTFLITLVEEQP
ncbi:MAG: cadherin-like domain-containing protein [Chloroflexota bacterium]|nr:cadherin-like domain-containing protein [Chloroflexota bacterium]